MIHKIYLSYFKLEHTQEIQIDKFQMNDSIEQWMNNFLYSSIFSHDEFAFMFIKQNITLFSFK